MEISLTPVLDIRPDVREHEASPWTSKCYACTFRTFITEVVPHEGGALGGLRKTFERMVEWSKDDIDAAREGTSQLEMMRGLGASRTYEIVDAGERARFSEAHVLRRAASAGVGSKSSEACARNGEALFVEPNKQGLEAVAEALLDGHERGFGRLFFGTHEHAATMDAWPHLWEMEDFSLRWVEMRQRLASAGIARLGLILGFPPCTVLQWRRFRHLETERARLDLAFRVIEGERSLMCPENVSGYALLNDTREFVDAHDIVLRGYGVRVDRTIFYFDERRAT